MQSEPQQPRQLRVAANGIELAAFEWNAELRGVGPTLVLAHATGFHARCWDQMVRRLPARHVIAVDQRGHGRSEKAAFDTWAVFGRDLVELLTELDLRAVVGVGHSMGGHATVAAAAQQPELFDRLVLIDPVIMAPDLYRANGAAPAELAASEHPTSRRRRSFESVDAMIERFAGREPYSLFVPEALEDYCRYGLVPAAAGDGFELACPPEFEASVYLRALGNAGIYDSVRRVEAPVTLLRAIEPPTPADIANFVYSPTWPGLAAEFRDAADRYLPELTHFMPMQDPQTVADLLGL